VKNHLSLTLDASVKTVDDGGLTAEDRYRRLQPVESVDVGTAVACLEPSLTYTGPPAKPPCSASSGKLI
jgi:hypothetical protein